MKRLTTAILILLMALVSTSMCLAASSATQQMKCSEGKTQCVITIAWIAHTDGSFTATALSSAYMRSLEDFYLYEMETDPGSTAPTDNYDITLTRTNTNFSYDVLGGRGVNRSTNTTQAVLPANTTGSRFPGVGQGDTWTLGITGNSQNGAVGVIRLWFVK